MALKYEILVAHGYDGGEAATRLEEIVNRYIALGWKPVGGIAATFGQYSDGEYTRDLTQLFQAVTKEEA